MRWGILCTLIPLALIVGCGDKGNGLTDASIIGQWAVVYAEINGEPANLPSGLQMDFRADHTRYQRVGGADAEWAYKGTWSLSGNQLTLTWGEVVVTYNYSIVNDTMTIAGLEGDDWVEIQLIRVE